MTKQKQPLTTTCPACGKTLTWSPENPFRPFCSERCKLIDLGDWASEKHRVPGDEIPPDELPDDKDNQSS